MELIKTNSYRWQILRMSFHSILLQIFSRCWILVDWVSLLKRIQLIWCVGYFCLLKSAFFFVNIKMAAVIKFKNRNQNDFVNKQIVETFRNGEAPDVDLLVANHGIFSAHRVILCMYSKYLRRALSHSNPDHIFVGNSKCFFLSFESGPTNDFLFLRRKRQFNREFVFHWFYFSHCNSIVPLLAFPLYAIQHVVELFYYGEIRVLGKIKTQVKKALDFLEVDWDIPTERHQARVPLNIMTTFTAAQMANQNIASQINGKFFIFISDVKIFWLEIESTNLG